MGKFYRMVRKGNGWQIECLENGKVRLIGDWDLRYVIENKILSEIVKASGS